MGLFNLLFNKIIEPEYEKDMAAEHAISDAHDKAVRAAMTPEQLALEQTDNYAFLQLYDDMRTKMFGVNG